MLIGTLYWLSHDGVGEHEGGTEKVYVAVYPTNHGAMKYQTRISIDNLNSEVII